MEANTHFLLSHIDIIVFLITGGVCGHVNVIKGKTSSERFMEHVRLVGRHRILTQDYPATNFFP